MSQDLPPEQKPEQKIVDTTNQKTINQKKIADDGFKKALRDNLQKRKQATKNRLPNDKKS